MNRIRGLELLFNLEKKNLKSKEDCLVLALHCLLIDDKFQCTGIGDTWPQSVETTTELLPDNWNSDQDVYTLRYISADKTGRVLLKIIKIEHTLQIDAVLNEDPCASMSIPVNNYISEDYSTYSNAYKDLDSLVESFGQSVTTKLKPVIKVPAPGTHAPQTHTQRTPMCDPLRIPNPPRDRRPQGCFPSVGGSDLDPFGFRGGGGMLMDPSSFGIPARPTLPQFGVGGPGGLPRAAVPPGARFDPFMPPIRSDIPRQPHPDFYRPDFDDYFM